MTPYWFHPEARKELQAAARLYQLESSALASAFASELRNVLGQILAFPESGAPVSGDIRKVFLTRFPFTVVYRSRAESIEVLAVMHQRRRPGYWRSRLGGS